MAELFWLIVGHFVADFVLQTPDMAKGKNHTAPPGYVPWQYWLTAHALVHGGVVAAVTGSVWLGLAEAAMHGLIDFAKCDGRIGFHQDQAAHGACKALWWVL